MSDSKRTATVSETVTALAHTGRGVELPAGVYEFVDIDGAAGRGVGYILVGGQLTCIDLDDPNISIEGGQA